jgi:hypothetical protein
MHVLGIMGLPGIVDKTSIKRAYRSMARKFHPDVATSSNSTAEEKKAASDRFAVINWAYAALMENEDLNSSSPSASSPYSHSAAGRTSQPDGVWGQRPKDTTFYSGVNSNDVFNWEANQGQSQRRRTTMDATNTKTDFHTGVNSNDIFNRHTTNTNKRTTAVDNNDVFHWQADCARTSTARRAAATGTEDIYDRQGRHSNGGSSPFRSPTGKPSPASPSDSRNSSETPTGKSYRQAPSAPARQSMAADGWTPEGFGQSVSGREQRTRERQQQTTSTYTSSSPRQTASPPPRQTASPPPRQTASPPPSSRVAETSVFDIFANTRRPHRTSSSGDSWVSEAFNTATNGRSGNEPQSKSSSTSAAGRRPPRQSCDVDTWGSDVCNTATDRRSASPPDWRSASPARAPQATNTKPSVSSHASSPYLYQHAWAPQFSSVS